MGLQKEEHSVEFLQAIVDRANGVDLTQTISASPATPFPDLADSMEAGQVVTICSGAVFSPPAALGSLMDERGFSQSKIMCAGRLAEQHLREVTNQRTDVGQRAVG